MTDLTLASIAGILISLVFSYVPGAADWYKKLTAQFKSLWMLAFLLLACVVIFLASCMGYSAQVACSVAGAKALVPMFISALIANQAAYIISPQK